MSLQIDTFASFNNSFCGANCDVWVSMTWLLVSTLVRGKESLSLSVAFHFSNWTQKFDNACMTVSWQTLSISACKWCFMGSFRHLWVVWPRPCGLFYLAQTRLVRSKVGTNRGSWLTSSHLREGVGVETVDGRHQEKHESRILFHKS